MLVLLSPAKKLDFDTPCSVNTQTQPSFIPKTNKLVKELKKLSADDIGKMMKLSDKLSELNYARFQSFKSKFNPDTSKQAGFAFNGDTYTGLDINQFNKSEVTAAQKQIRILSGLYGVLAPLDLIQPYRLEMGTKFKFLNAKNLYEYWSSDVTTRINDDLKAHKALINCASNEYFDVVNKKDIIKPIVTPIFKDLKNGEYKIISFNAKRARGMMARFIVQNKIKEVKDLQKFNLAGYKYNKKMSTELTPTFTRD